jgi:hypothetical protein
MGDAQTLQAEIHAMLAAVVAESISDDSMFAGGMRAGLVVALALTQARAIRERRARDAARSKSHAEIYRRHDQRAQAFEEAADSIRSWSARLDPSRSESDVPDSVAP